MLIIYKQAARQGFADTVNVLMQAGANLGDFEADFVRLAVKTATRSNDHMALTVWSKTGTEI